MLKNNGFNMDKIIYDNTTKENIELIRMMNDSNLLDEIAKHYNWDDGLDIPKKIINNSNCDLSTALYIFYCAGGYDYFVDKDGVLNSEDITRKDFLINLYNKIVQGDYQNKRLPFAVPLTKVQIYKIRKMNIGLSNIFFD